MGPSRAARPVRLTSAAGRPSPVPTRRSGHSLRRVHVAVALVELHIPQARSLKEKRGVVRPIVEGLRHRFQLSVAEVAYQDKWQRAQIGFAVVSETHAHAEEVVGAVERWIWSRADIEVSTFRVDWSTYEGEV